MEIINCIDPISYRKPNTSLLKHSLFSGKRAILGSFNKTQNSFYSVSNSSYSIDNKIDFLSVIKNLKYKIGIFTKQVKIASQFAWLIPVVALCAIAPYCVSRFISYSDSFAKKVDFSKVDKFQILDNAMNDFAFDKSSYFDSEGNVFSEFAAQNVPNAVKLKQPVVFQNYVVSSGDTISGISSKFGLSNISTLIAINNISNVRSIYTGQKLLIPSMDGLIHTVSINETLESISKKYGASISDLLDANDLSTEVLQANQKLFIPGARLDTTSLRRAMGEIFVNPLKSKYRLSSRFGPRADPFTGVASNHTGIDMACPTGTPIYASMSGKVAYTGFSSVFGNYVIINHFDGYQTLYAHMSRIIAKKGENVNQGTKIGLVGSTGYSTGPHLHFTVYKNSKLVDPLTVLK